MDRKPVPESQLIETEAGLKPADDGGWFVVNLADAAAEGIDATQYGFGFEASRGAFPHFGINVSVLGAGKPIAMYHAETSQEAFLVLEGECILIVEGRERLLRRWDFFHCPPSTAHVLVGAGDGPCAILAVGAREEAEEIVYPVSELAVRHGAGVKVETTEPAEAYADWPRAESRRFPWPPGSGTEGEGFEPSRDP